MSGDHVTHQMGAPFHRGAARAEALKSLGHDPFFQVTQQSWLRKQPWAFQGFILRWRGPRCPRSSEWRCRCRPCAE